MAWANGNKQWTFPFKSLNDTACRIDVYKRGYTGDLVLSLKAAATPFFFEEDEDDDLLNNVLRYSTGYIRVVEEYSVGWLDDIYPTGIFDRWVEVYYGDVLTFSGYIQVQDFNSEMVPVPRVIELPVISPLGLFRSMKFNNILYMPPRDISLGELLDAMLSSTNTSYERVYLPKNYGYPNPVNLAMKVSTLVATPWNEDFHHSMNVQPSYKVMTGQTYEYIVEGICKAFGWICHDTPDALIFTAFDFEGDYCYFPVGNIGDPNYQQDANIPSSAADLLAYFSLADDNANERTLQPDTGIEISYEGDSGNRDFDFKRTYVDPDNPVVIEPSSIPTYDVFPNHAEIFSLCSLVPVPTVNETELVGATPSFTNDDYLDIGNYIVGWNGKIGVMMSMSSSYQSGLHMFYVRFYMRRRPGQKYSLSFDMIENEGPCTLGALNTSPDNDDYYITGSLDTSHNDYIQANFSYKYQGADSDHPQLAAHALIFIYNIKLEVCENGVPYEELRYKPSSVNDVIGPSGTASNVTPSISSSITMPISLYRLNDHLIGNSVRSTKVTEYPYLFQPRKEIRGRFRITNALTFPHVRMFTYMNKKWRIIARRFDVWNDEMRLTLQNSPTL